MPSQYLNTSLLPVLALLLISIIIGQSSGQSQRITLYDGRSSTGGFVTIGANYVPDLTSYNFNNRARSVCVTGIWLLYDLAQYNSNGNHAMEYIYGNNYCTDLAALGDAVSSVRYAGPPGDYRASSLTLFTGTYFQGLEEFTFGNLPNLNLNGRIASLIVSGAPTDGWTLYDRPNYTGNAICVYPPVTTIFEPAFIYDTNIINVPRNTIQSVRKGCFGVKTATVEASQQGFQKLQGTANEK